MSNLKFAWITTPLSNCRVVQGTNKGQAHGRRDCFCTARSVLTWPATKERQGGYPRIAIGQIAVSLRTEALAGGGTMLDLRPYLRRPIATLASVAADPREAWIRFRERFTEHREGPPPPDLYKAEDDWESRLHRLLDLSSPAEVTSEFWTLWPNVIEDLDAKGVRAGPASFKGWNDGDAAFVRAIWCLTRHLRPGNVVETGVAHGVHVTFHS